MMKSTVNIDEAKNNNRLSVKNTKNLLSEAEIKTSENKINLNKEKISLPKANEVDSELDKEFYDEKVESKLKIYSAIQNFSILLRR